MGAARRGITPARRARSIVAVLRNKRYRQEINYLMSKKGLQG